jgi:hypothetical protein
MTATAASESGLDLAPAAGEPAGQDGQTRSPSWRERPAAQQPQWPDPDRLAAVTAQLAVLPPLVFAGECDQLTERLAMVAGGQAFVLQGGDCAETFAGSTAEAVRAGWRGSSPSRAPRRPRSGTALSCQHTAVTR